MIEKNIDLNKLTTEKRNKNTLNIDRVSTLEMVKIINKEDGKVAKAIESQLDKIAKGIDTIVEKINLGGRLIYMGAGTSGRLGILDASECPPTFGVSEELVQGIIAGGTEAIFRAKEGAEDSKEKAVIDLKGKGLNKNDVVIGLAASGRTPYVIGGLEYANSLGCYTMSISCNENSEVSKFSKTAIEVIVGPEVITGSTRLKAGTAQKMVLNMLSTGVMIRLGKVYSNLMIDVKATNKKLIERTKKIVIEATGVDKEKAEKILKETDYNVKLTILMILLEISKEEAIKKLSESKGYIAKAL
ncbi:N-acetylmuramic acid 6-phosphate etherase [Clostridium fallax]|uniref:N-acetylmuramic acid 6-phosphate etherase n=1 Tax=Clostridium fallax TaxID=1533 RepID=A0A1M4T027_9CLOT|nr:N-acetylmuramic acid 6-phosphate etherase [Clostridium fallax]SQB08060.1 N-acetylmuramic acid 6-phosphate etherase [Clostridium fallax]